MGIFSIGEWLKAKPEAAEQKKTRNETAQELEKAIASANTALEKAKSEYQRLFLDASNRAELSAHYEKLRDEVLKWKREVEALEGRRSRMGEPATETEAKED